MTIYQVLEKKHTDVIYGDIRKFGRRDKQIRHLSRRKLCATTICHQAIFYRKETFDIIGGYDTSYALCADREHLIRLYTSGCSFRFIPAVLCEYLGNGASESRANAVKMREEDEKIQKQHFTERERRHCKNARRFKRFFKKLLKRG